MPNTSSQRKQRRCSRTPRINRRDLLDANNSIHACSQTSSAARQVIRHHNHAGKSLTCAKSVIWWTVSSPVKRLETDSSRLPVNRPRVPASVLSRPAFQVPSAKLLWMTCLKEAQDSSGQRVQCNTMKQKLLGSLAAALSCKQRVCTCACHQCDVQSAEGASRQPCASRMMSDYTSKNFRRKNKTRLALQRHGGALHDDGANQDPDAAQEEVPPGSMDRQEVLGGKYSRCSVQRDKGRKATSAQQGPRSAR